MARPHELSDAELDAYCRQFGPLFGGSVLDTELPPLGNQFWIVLMCPPGQSSSGHWVLTFDCFPDRVLFFDSMGVSPTDAVHRRMLQTGKVRQYSNLQEQGMRQITCGFFCAFVSKRLVEGATFEHILRDELHPLQFAANQRLVLTLGIGKNSSPLSCTSSALMPPRRSTGGRVRKVGGKVKRGGRCGGRTVAGGRCQNPAATCPHKH